MTPSERDGRCSSATADATHFVNCAGLVALIDCHFQGQMDDPTNVHGIYERISRIISPTEIEIELVHDQQAGVHITPPGDDLEFVSNDTLRRYHVSGVTAVEPLNFRFCRVTLDAPPPEAKVAASRGETAFVVDAGSGALAPLAVPKASSWDVCDTVRGSVKTASAGDHEVTVRPADPATWKPMDLAFVTLTRTGD